MIKLPKIKVGKFLKKVITAAPKVVGKVAKLAPVVGGIVSTAEDALGAIRSRKQQGQSTAEAAANTAAQYSPEANTTKYLLIGAAVVILFLLVKGR